MNAPSIIEGMPMEEYQAREEVSSHDLKMIHKAPYLYRHAKDTGVVEEEMRIGTLLHLAVLEPDQLEAEVAILPEDAPAKPLPAHHKMRAEGRDLTDSAKERFGFWDDWNEKTQGKSNVSAKDLKSVQGMHRSLLATPNVRDAITMEGLREACGFFTLHDVACRMRPDLWTADEIVDLKSCSDCSRESFSRDIYKQRYHAQASFYMEGSAAIGRPMKQFVWVAVETKPPYLCSVHISKPGSLLLNLGSIDNLRGLDQHKKSTASGYWPGVRQYSEEIELPTYAA